MSPAVALVRTLGILAAVLFGGISTWEARFEMDSDGISYLDMADAYARHDWEHALNSVWSPLYSWMLIPILWALKPNAYWEFPLVQGANFLIYLGALAAFTYCLRELMRYRHWRAGGEASSPAVRSVPEWMLYALGYAVFMWGTLLAIEVTNVGPHMMLAALTFLTVGLLMRLRRHPESWWSWGALGLVLGLTYLARVQSLIFVAVYLVLAVLPRLAERRVAPRLLLRPLLTVSIVVAMACVYVVPLLVVKGQLAGSDLVRLNYAWYVNDIPIRHWQGDPPYGAPVHPTRVLLTRPTVFEFDGPVGGTYPPWYDPSYWYEGVEPRFDLMGHVRRFVMNLRWQPPHQIVTRWHATLAVYLIVVGFLLHQRLLPWSTAKAYAAFWAPAILALAMYTILTILPRRFLGAYLPLLWVGAVAGISWQASYCYGRRLRQVVMLALIFHLTIATAVAGTRALRGVITPAPHTHWQVAQSLHALGIPEGSKVAVIGRGWDHSRWARLSRMRIVAEIPTRFTPEFWGASDERKREVAARLQAIGVRAIVVHPGSRLDAPIPDGGGPWRWSDLNGTGYLALIIRE